MGRKKKPFYRIIAIDSRKRRDGNFIEKIGVYNPIVNKNELQIEIDHEKALKWLLCGAQPSTTVNSLLKKDGVLLKFDMMKRIKREKQVIKKGDKEIIKYKAVRDENGDLVKKFTDEEIQSAYQKWLEGKEVKSAKLEAKKSSKLSKKAKAKLAEKSDEKKAE